VSAASGLLLLRVASLTLVTAFGLLLVRAREYCWEQKRWNRSDGTSGALDAQLGIASFEADEMEQIRLKEMESIGNSILGCESVGDTIRSNRLD
jgi:hypothetical protein